jgi:hypothetical protein
MVGSKNEYFLELSNENAKKEKDIITSKKVEFTQLLKSILGFAGIPWGILNPIQRV